MPRQSLNQNLHAARAARNDEFYTQLDDIERELRHYKDHFKGKVVLCNCDDPWISNFFKYFANNFEFLGLKKLITTCYRNQNRDLFSQNDSEKAIWLEYNGDKDGNRVPDPEEIGIHEFVRDGDFRSEECIELLKQADIVVTNPPFSLFREYVQQLVQYRKSFLIIGPESAITYKGVFTLIRDGHLWLGHGFANGNAFFRTPNVDSYADGVYDPVTGLVKFRNVEWFTNLEHSKRHEELILYKTYDPKFYPKYDNYDAIEVRSIADIPCDYDGVMGVPVTFLEKFNPNQFEILGSNRDVDQDPNRIYGRGSILNGKEVYKRVFIRNRNPIS